MKKKHKYKVGDIVAYNIGNSDLLWLARIVYIDSRDPFIPYGTEEDSAKFHLRVPYPKEEMWGSTTSWFVRYDEKFMYPISLRRKIIKYEE